MIRVNAGLFCLIMYGFLSLNAIFISLAPSFEVSNKSTLLYVGDTYGDFIKTILSYPAANGIAVRNGEVLGKITNDSIKNNPFGGVDRLESGGVTTFGLMPLTTLHNLIVAEAMASISPGVVFLASLLALLLWYVMLAHKVSKDSMNAFILVLSIVLSYPFEFMAQRGNLASGYTSLLICAYFVWVVGRQSSMMAILFIALATNIRPNAAILSLFLLCYGSRAGVKMFFSYLLISIAIFFVSLSIDEIIYPSYGLSRFLKGVENYHNQYVVGDLGTAYNSSLFGLLKYLYGYNRHLEYAATLFPMAIAIMGVILYYKKRLSKISFAFTLCAAYASGTAVFANYHLLSFAAIFYAVLYEQKLGMDSYQSSDYGRKEINITILAVCALLVHKSYIFDVVSFMDFLNPVICITVPLGIYVFSIYSHHNIVKRI